MATLYKCLFYGGYSHCVKSVQIPSLLWSVFSCTRAEYGPEKTLYLNTFYAVSSCLTISILFTAPNIMTEQKGKGYQGIRAIEAFEYENTRSYFKCCDYTEKNEIKYVRLQLSKPGTQGTFSGNVAPDIGDFKNFNVMFKL